jgi:hypothetical protein
MNNDLISRQVAIDLLKKWSDGYSYKALHPIFDIEDFGGEKE